MVPVLPVELVSSLEQQQYQPSQFQQWQSVESSGELLQVQYWTSAGGGADVVELEGAAG